MRRQNYNKSCPFYHEGSLSFKKERDKKKIILGLTGSFGSGKTSVARMFYSPSTKIIDADKIAHRLIKPGNKIYRRIVYIFGKNILKRNKTIDRNKLAEIVFNDKNLLGRLNKIMHPAVIRVIKSQIRTASKKVVVLDAPLLLEAGLKSLVDKLIIVKINRKKQLTRILKKTNLSKTDILKRISRQMSLKKKVRFADFIIDNNGSIEETKKQVEQIRRRLWKS